MKKIPHIAMLVCGVLALGCTRTEVVPVVQSVAVNLSGELQSVGALTRGDGMIDPILADSGDERGLPPKQLGIGIMTIEIDSETPTAADWGDLAYSPYLDRGFFGGNKPGDTPASMRADWNGNIEYTDRGGANIQMVFYSRTGEYYHFVCVYPYDDIILSGDDDYTMQNAAGDAAIVSFDIDGSGDIMASNSGYGNIEHPFGGQHSTFPTDGTLIFYHKLTALRCKFKAESETAVSLYGTINSVELVGQPDVVGLNIGEQALDTATPLIDQRTTVNGIAYPAIGSDGTTATTAAPMTLEVTDALTFGYMMALPAQTYTFRITTSVHGASNPLYATYDFMTAAVPLAKPAAGTIYNLTFTMMESAKIVLEAAEAEDWYLDQTFD